MLSVVRQCELLGLSRSSLYFEPGGESEENLRLMRMIDEEYLRRPFWGSRKLSLWLKDQGENVNRKRVQRLMRTMGIEAIYPKPKTTMRGEGHQIYPYLLREMKIVRSDQVWATDITYIPMASGFMCLVAVMDWYSRHVLSWRLSNTMESEFCVEALEEALKYGRPEIFNTDQGSQFTSDQFTNVLKSAGVLISMNGKGRCLDNVFVERLWRSVKYEEIYLKSYADVPELQISLEEYFDYYSHARPHQSLEYSTPSAVYHGIKKEGERDCPPLGTKQRGAVPVIPPPHQPGKCEG